MIDIDGVGRQDPWHQVSEIIRLIRASAGQTRPELVDATRLGRNIVGQRLQTAQQLGLIEPTGEGRSRGGRAADIWTFSPGAGQILVGQIGIHVLRVALTDLNGGILFSSDTAWATDGTGPEATCARMADMMDDLLEQAEITRPWGIAIGMPAPVDPTTGRGIDPIPSTTEARRWPTEFDVRHWFTQRFKAAVWSESVSNLSALGAASAGDAASDLVFVRLGTGVGAGLVSHGELHRGAASLAGLLSHVQIHDDPERPCHCGRVGCLDTYAGGWALLQDARRAAADGRSTYLTSILAGRDLTLDDLDGGVERGEPVCVEILVRAADALGRALGSMITWFNPGELIIGGHRLVLDPLFRTVVERAMGSTALGASLDALVVRAGDADQIECIRGAAELATQTLLSPGYLAEWGPQGSPVDATALLDRDQQV